MPLYIEHFFDKKFKGKNVKMRLYIQFLMHGIFYLFFHMSIISFILIKYLYIYNYGHDIFFL